MDNSKILAVPEELRTFETRLQFLSSIYTAKYDGTAILAKCIGHKLDRDYLVFLEDLKASEYYLMRRRDNMYTLKQATRR